jgi:OOP family OmpA-OmpF porin
MPARAALIVAVMLAAAPAAASGRDCAAIDADARTAEVGGDLASLARLHAEAAAPGSTCGADWLADFGEDVAKAYVDRFFVGTEVAGGGPAAMRDHLHLLEEGRRYGEPWQLLLTLAEVRYELGEWNAAAPLYAAAVARMSTALRTLSPGDPDARQLPDVESFRIIHGRMTQAALLATEFQPPAVERGAPQTGLYVESWRGYAVKAVPVPVQFEFGTTDFTEKGRRAAEHLAAYLKTSKLPSVTLVGHTDPVGSEADNRALSLARAEAVRDFVAAAGYAGRIAVEGRGESEPFRAVDAARFAGDEPALHALDRRVELIR